MVLTCEQAVLFGEKNSKEREGKGGTAVRRLEAERPFRFSLSPVPRLTKGLFTVYNGVGIHLFS